MHIPRKIPKTPDSPRCGNVQTIHIQDVRRLEQFHMHMEDQTSPLWTILRGRRRSCGLARGSAFLSVIWTDCCSQRTDNRTGEDRYLPWQKSRTHVVHKHTKWLLEGIWDMIHIRRIKSLVS